MCEQGQERWLTTDTEVLFVETSICVLRRVTSCPGLPGPEGVQGCGIFSAKSGEILDKLDRSVTLLSRQLVTLWLRLVLNNELHR